MSKLLLLVAIAGAAAVIAQKVPSQVSVEEVVPEYDEFVQDESTAPEELDVHKASACSVGDTCTFEIQFSVQGGTANPNEDLFQLNRELNKVKYTVQVTPEAQVGSHSKLWEVQGLDLLSVASEHAPATERTNEFKNCKVSLLQGERTGHVHAILQDQNEKCPAELMQLLVASVSSLTPVKGHSTKTAFHHDDTRGEDQQRTMYKTSNVNGASTVVKGVTHHRFHNEEDLMASEEAAHFRDIVHNHKSRSTTTIVDNTVHHHHVEAKVRLAPTESVITPSTGPSQHMPESLYGGSQRYEQKDMSALVSHTVKKIQTAKAPTSVASMEDTSVDQFLSQSRQQGKTVTMLKDSVVQQPEKVNPFSLLSEAAQAHYFDKLVRSIPDTPKDLASAKVSSMMQVKAAHKIFMHHVKQGKIFKMLPSAMLIGGLSRARPFPTANLLSLANNEKLPNYTREQAMWALIQSECIHDHHTAAISALESTANSGSSNTLGLHTTAMQLQHLLASSAVRCTQGKAAGAVKGLLDSTEQRLLQNMESSNWGAAAMDLVALGNSRFERHSQVVQKVLEHPSVPKAVAHKARHVASLLPGKLAAQLVQNMEEIAVSSKEAEKDIGFAYDWETKFPPDGKNGAPNPKFQAIPKLEAGINTDDGVYGAGYVEVKLWDDAHTYTALKLQVNVAFSGADAMRPVTTLSTVGDFELYTTASNTDDDWDAEEEEETETLGLVSTEKIGYCETDINSFKGFQLSFDTDRDIFTAPSIHFWVGPVPLSISFKLKGMLAFQAGLGFLGGGTTNMLKMYGVNDAVSTSTSVHCGGGSAFSDGGLVYMMPSGGINVDGNAGVDAGIVEAGIGLDVKIYEAKVPVTLEFSIGGTSGANCLGAEINSESGSGRMYLYFDSWFTNRKEWDLFEWTGATWSYPTGKQKLGLCSQACNLPELTPPTMPDPQDTDCIVGFYAGDWYGGDNAYKYFLQSNSQSGELKMLPTDISNNVRSVQTFGNCENVELLDDDYGVAVGNSNNGWIFDVGGRGWLPWDLVNDIQGVNIKALAPHVAQPKPTTDWHSCCMLIVYWYNDYIGKQSIKKRCHGGNQWFGHSGGVNSLELSPGCDRVWIDDDDYWGDDDTTTWHSISDLPWDYQDDIAAFHIYDRSELELVEDVASSSVVAGTSYEWNATATAEQLHPVVNASNGCWTCSPYGDKGRSECFESADKEQATDEELEVCKNPDTGEVATHKRDDGCHCNNRKKHSQEVHDAAVQQEYKETCDFCGFFKTSAEEKQQCQDACHAQPVSIDACSQDCMGDEA